MGSPWDLHDYGSIHGSSVPFVSPLNFSLAHRVGKPGLVWVLVNLSSKSFDADSSAITEVQCEGFASRFGAAEGACYGVFGIVKVVGSLRSLDLGLITVPSRQQKIV